MTSAWALFAGLASGAILTWATRPPGPRILAWQLDARHWRDRALTAEADLDATETALAEAEHRADVTARAHLRHITGRAHASREQAQDIREAAS